MLRIKLHHAETAEPIGSAISTKYAFRYLVQVRAVSSHHHREIPSDDKCNPLFGLSIAERDSDRLFPFTVCIQHRRSEVQDVLTVFPSRRATLLFCTGLEEAKMIGGVVIFKRVACSEMVQRVLEQPVKQQPVANDNRIDALLARLARRNGHQ